jgi:hypothetical protein
MYSKRFIVFVCLALVSGLMVGLLSFRDEFEVLAPKFYAEVNIIYAYFQILNVSRDSGIFYEKMVSSVVVLNITNPTEKIFEIRELQMWFGNKIESGNTVGFTDMVASYYNDFESGHSTYYWHPGESRLVAFSLTNAVQDGGINILNAHEIGFSLELYTAGLGEPPTPDYMISRITEKLQLKTLNENEFVYGDYFNADRQFGFDNSMIDIMGPAVR